MKRMVLAGIVVLAVVFLLCGCGDSPSSKYIGKWSNDSLKYGTVVLLEKNRCEFQNFQGNTSSTTWKLEDEAGSYILIGDGKTVNYKAHFVVGDDTILVITTPENKDLYMYKQEK